MIICVWQAFVCVPRKKPSWIYRIEVYIGLYGGPKSTQIAAIFTLTWFSDIFLNNSM